MRSMEKNRSACAFTAAVETVAWTDSVKAARVAEAYAGAKAADDAFEAALVAAYRGRHPGPNAARYDIAVRKTWPEEVRAAYQRKREADERLRFFQNVGDTR